MSAALLWAGSQVESVNSKLLTTDQILCSSLYRIYQKFRNRRVCVEATMSAALLWTGSQVESVNLE